MQHRWVRERGNEASMFGNDYIIGLQWTFLSEGRGDMGVEELLRLHVTLSTLHRGLSEERAKEVHGQRQTSEA